MSQMSTTQPQGPGTRRRGKEIAGVLLGLGLAVLLGLGAWLLFRDTAENDAAPSAVTFGPAIVDEATLRAETARVGHTVYWLPPQGRVMELTIGEEANVQIRYLPPDAVQPDPGTAHTTVSSWPMADPLAEAQKKAGSQAAMSQDAPSGGLYVTGSDSPYNAFIGEPKATALGEVYDPRPGRAWRDVTEGKVSVLQP